MEWKRELSTVIILLKRNANEKWQLTYQKLFEIRVPMVYLKDHPPANLIRRTKEKN